MDGLNLEHYQGNVIMITIITIDVKVEHHSQMFFLNTTFNKELYLVSLAHLTLNVTFRIMNEH